MSACPWTTSNRRLTHSHRKVIKELRKIPKVAGLREKLAPISQKTKIAEAIRYILSRWEGLCLFRAGGRIDIDSNVMERAIRPLPLNRKNALFAGSDGGAEPWAVSLR
jgi:transposase